LLLSVLLAVSCGPSLDQLKDPSLSSLLEARRHTQQAFRPNPIEAHRLSRLAFFLEVADNDDDDDDDASIHHLAGQEQPLLAYTARSASQRYSFSRFDVLSLAPKTSPPIS